MVETTGETSKISPQSEANPLLEAALKSSGRALSDGSTAPSVSSLTSSTNDYLYKIIHGRAFSSASELYVLPADDDEHSRLDMQHFALCLSINSLFPFKKLITNAIRKNRESPPEIADIGTGSGRWAVDMATSYPWTKVVGVDLVPPALLDRGSIPANCRFEIDDANLTTEHYANTFSLVHARSIDSGLNDTVNFMYEAARALKPGGVFCIGAGGAQFYDENFQKLRADLPEDDPNFTWTEFVAGKIYEAYMRRGCLGVNGPLHWKRWAESNPNFSEVHEEEIFVPMGPWKEGMTEQERFISNLMREAVARVFVAFKRALLADGHEEAIIDRWTRESATEMREATKHIYSRFYFVAAVRSDVPWQQRVDMEELEDERTRSLVAGIDLAAILSSQERSAVSA